MRRPDLHQKPRLVALVFIRFVRRQKTMSLLRAALFLGVLAGGGTSWGQTWISAISASSAASTAKITWATAVPSDSQVEYGSTAAYGNVTPLSTAKVASHSVTVSDLKAGTTYHFRVRSSDTSGVQVIGPDYALRISIPVTVALAPQGVTIAASATQRFTATVSNDPNQAVSWSATAGTVSSSGLFTAPNISSNTPVTVTATSQADPTKSGSTVLTVSAAQAASTVLFGHPTVEALVNGLYAGMAEGYQMTASITGTLNTLSVYVDPASTATNLFVGLYADSNGHPGTRLTGGSSDTFQKAAWNTISVPPVSIVPGSKYWFVLLGTGGVLKFRQKPTTGGWVDELNAIRTLTSLPSTWTTGTIYAGGAWTSVYGSGATSEPPLGTPLLSVIPSSFNWTAKVGTSNIAPGSVSVTNTGTGSLQYAGVSDQPWLTISSGNGTVPSILQIVPSIAGLKAGTYVGHVNLSGGGITKTVTVVLSMTSAPPVQHTVSLSWKSPTRGKVVSYSLYRSTVRGGSYGLLASAISGTLYNDQTAQTGAPYYYVVTAVDGQGRESPYSNEIGATIP